MIILLTNHNTNLFHIPTQKILSFILPNTKTSKIVQMHILTTHDTKNYNSKFNSLTSQEETQNKFL